MRIYLTGRLALETDSGLLEEARLPARQGLIAFAYLVLQRRRPVPRPELAEAIWGEEVPNAWDTSLSALLSRLRRLFRGVALSGELETLTGSVSLVLTDDAWVDIDAARNAIDEAEGGIRAGRHPKRGRTPR